LPARATTSPTVAKETDDSSVIVCFDALVIGTAPVGLKVVAP
jgi:hypothetical protein